MFSHLRSNVHIYYCSGSHEADSHRHVLTIDVRIPFKAFDLSFFHSWKVVSLIRLLHNFLLLPRRSPAEPFHLSLICFDAHLVIMPITSRWTIDIPQVSLASLLLTSPAHPLSDDAIFLDAGSPATKYLTQNSYRVWSQRFAAGLRRAGLKDGDRVLLFSANSIFFPVIFMGVIMAGGVFTGSNPLSVASELAYQLKDSDASFLLCATANLNTGLEAAIQAGLPKGQIFVFDDAPITGEIGQPSLGCDHWSSLLSSEAEGKAFHWKDLSLPNECHQTVALNYSSGTTGFPKGVEITHYNYVAHTLQMQHMDNLLADSMVRKAVDRWLCFLPMYHAMAQAVFISLALRRGIPVYIMSHFSFIKMLEYVQDFRITRLMVIPSVLVKMAKDSRIRRGDWDLSSIVELGCGAAPLAGDIIKELKTEWPWNDDRVDERGKLAVTQGYGMTEYADVLDPWNT